MVTRPAGQNVLGHTAVVIGTGMAGLLATVEVSEFFENVIVVERGKLATEPELRRGVPQGAHVHTLLCYAVETFDKLIPGMVERLYDAGAARIRRNLDIWFHDIQRRRRRQRCICRRASLTTCQNRSHRPMGVHTL